VAGGRAHVDRGEKKGGDLGMAKSRIKYSAAGLREGRESKEQRGATPQGKGKRTLGYNEKCPPKRPNLKHRGKGSQKLQEQQAGNPLAEGVDNKLRKKNNRKNGCGRRHTIFSPKASDGDKRAISLSQGGGEGRPLTKGKKRSGNQSTLFK